MSINVYKIEDTSYVVGTDQESSFVIAKNRKSNFSLVKKLYISSTSTDTWHSNITIFGSSTGAVNVVDGSQDFGLKLYYGSLEPSDKLWNNISYGNTARINNLGTSGSPDNSFYPLWLYIYSPSSVDLGIYPFDLIINSVEHPV